VLAISVPATAFEIGNFRSKFGSNVFAPLQPYKVELRHEGREPKRSSTIIRRQSSKFLEKRLGGELANLGCLFLIGDLG
jgi:hypothetical protein